MEFTVKLERYEGPYTKLLELIASRKLSITEINLAAVADDYIAHIRSLDQNDILDISQFIVVASTLMLIKVKSLLPEIQYSEEEERQVHDLEEKLELYALLEECCGQVRRVYDKSPIYGREYSYHITEPIFVPDMRVTSAFLQSIAFLTLQTIPVPESLVKVSVEQNLKIENVIESIMERIKNASSVALDAISPQSEDKEVKKKNLIVTFLALLELVKTGRVDVTQHDENTITVSKREELVPTL